MAVPQTFRSAFHGFNREDVAHYLEYINTKYQNQIDQLTTENQELQAAAQQRELAAQDNFELEAVKARCEELAALLEAEKARCQELTQQLEAAQQENAAKDTPVPAETHTSLAAEELEAYRRAERLEREARERADLIYFQASGVLTEASTKVDVISNDISGMADQLMSTLTQLQIAVSSSKQALTDASAIMKSLRPNK